MKYIATLCFITYSVISYSQIQAEIGFNAIYPKDQNGSDFHRGFGLSVEPKYFINHQIDVGVLIGVNAFVGAQKTPDGSEADYRMALFVPIQATGTYTFTSGKFMPFAGIGVGMGRFNAAATNKEESTVNEVKEVLLNISPRAGIAYKGVALTATYHLMQDARFFLIGLAVKMLKKTN